MSTIVVEEEMAGGQPSGHPENHEILFHGCLRRSLSSRPGERPFYVRFQHRGRYIPYLTPDAHWHERGNSCLVRIYAVDDADALLTLEYHYATSIDRSKQIEIERREPVNVIDHILQRVVVWPSGDVTATERTASR